MNTHNPPRAQERVIRVTPVKIQSYHIGPWPKTAEDWSSVKYRYTAEVREQPLYLRVAAIIDWEQCSVTGCTAITCIGDRIHVVGESAEDIAILVGDE